MSRVRESGRNTLPQAHRAAEPDADAAPACASMARSPLYFGFYLEREMLQAASTTAGRAGNRRRRARHWKSAARRTRDVRGRRRLRPERGRPSLHAAAGTLECATGRQPVRVGIRAVRPAPAFSQAVQRIPSRGDQPRSGSSPAASVFNGKLRRRHAGGGRRHHALTGRRASAGSRAWSVATRLALLMSSCMITVSRRRRPTEARRGVQQARHGHPAVRGDIFGCRRRSAHGGLDESTGVLAGERRAMARMIDASRREAVGKTRWRARIAVVEDSARPGQAQLDLDHEFELSTS